jgi:hypothetical protein
MAEPVHAQQSPSAAHLAWPLAWSGNTKVKRHLARHDGGTAARSSPGLRPSRVPARPVDVEFGYGASSRGNFDHHFGDVRVHSDATGERAALPFRPTDPLGLPVGRVPESVVSAEDIAAASRDMQRSLDYGTVDWRRAVRRAAERPSQPLDNQVLPSLKASHPGFSDDLRAVRVHTDDAAADAADRLSARAFTVGSHIFFRRGEYPPAEPEGTRLLVHELTHVEQGPDTPASEAWKLAVSGSADASEQAASEAAKGSGGATPRQGGLAAKPTIRRVLAAYSSSHSEILPSMGEAASVTSVTSTADSARIRAALAALIAAGKVEVSSIGDRDFYSLPARGAAIFAEVLAAFSAAGFARAVEMTAVLVERHNAKLFTGEELYELHQFWTQTIDRDRDVIRQTDRPLTSEETAEARLVFGPGLNYSAIRVTEDPLFGAGGIARTIPSGINFPVGASSSSVYMPWLIHELTHCWQYQHGRSVFATATRALLCWAGVSSYSYGGKPALVAVAAAGGGLSSFNTEQQGDIARDYYFDLKGRASVTEYAPFLTEFRTPP